MGGNAIVAEDSSRKREIRLQKNREAARECRRKKKEYIKCLENRVAVLENQNKALIEELKSLKELYCQQKTDWWAQLIGSDFCLFLRTKRIIIYEYKKISFSIIIKNINSSSSPSTIKYGILFLVSSVFHALHVFLKRKKKMWKEMILLLLLLRKQTLVDCDWISAETRCKYFVVCSEWLPRTQGPKRIRWIFF